MGDAVRTIGVLAREAGVHVETVRYYERRGILRAPKRTAGWRRYDDDAVRTRTCPGEGGGSACPLLSALDPQRSAAHA